MNWPASIADKNGRSFKLRTKECDKQEAHYYFADLISPDGEEAGYVWFRDERDDRMVFHDLEIYEQHSHAGLGPRLVRIVEEEAARLGKTKIVGHVEARNQTSGKKHELASWYRRLGYEVTQTDFTEKNYYGSLEKVLKKG